METGTAQDGSLRYQELLPSDSALYSVVFFFDERTEKTPVLGEVIKGHVKDAVSTHIQLGGDASLGRGLMEISWKSATEISGGGK
jgi:CRISPR-associated protein Cmr4